MKKTQSNRRLEENRKLTSSPTGLSGRQLKFETLEDRRVLATFTVSNLNDGPVAAEGDLPGSLRQAIFDANDKPRQ